MREAQFRQMLANRRRSWSPLFAGREATRLLRSAAAAQRRSSRAAAAWEQCADPQWRSGVRVAAVEADGLVIFEAARPAQLELLRRNRAEILKRLQRLVIGVRSVRFDASGASGESRSGSASELREVWASAAPAALRKLPLGLSLDAGDVLLVATGDETDAETIRRRRGELVVCFRRAGQWIEDVRVLEPDVAREPRR